MKTIKLKRTLNRRALVKPLAFLIVGFYATYGAVASTNNLIAWTGGQIDAFATGRVLSRDLVDKELITKEVPVIRTEDATSAVANAAVEGAKAGTEAAVKEALGRPGK
jgi:hypothetical protein